MTSREFIDVQPATDRKIIFSVEISTPMKEYASEQELVGTLKTGDRLPLLEPDSQTVKNTTPDGSIKQLLDPYQTERTAREEKDQPQHETQMPRLVR